MNLSPRRVLNCGTIEPTYSFDACFNIPVDITQEHIRGKYKDKVLIMDLSRDLTLFPREFDSFLEIVAPYSTVETVLSFIGEQKEVPMPLVPSVEGTVSDRPHGDYEFNLPHSTARPILDIPILPLVYPSIRYTVPIYRKIVVIDPQFADAWKALKLAHERQIESSLIDPFVFGGSPGQGKSLVSFMYGQDYAKTGNGLVLFVGYPSKQYVYYRYCLFWKGFVLYATFGDPSPAFLYTLLKSLAPDVLICDGCRGKSGESFTSILSDLTTLNSNHPDIKPFVILTVSEQSHPDPASVFSLKKYNPWSLVDFKTYIPQMIAYGRENGIEIDYLISNLFSGEGNADSQNLSHEQLLELIEDKFFVAGYNSRLMLDTPFLKVRSILTEYFAQCSNADWVKSPTNQQAMNTLLVTINGKTTFNSLFTLELMGRTQTDLQQAFRIADKENNVSQIDWLFEIEVKNRIRFSIDHRKMAFDHLHAISKPESAFDTQRLVWVPQNGINLYLPAKEIIEYSDISNLAALIGSIIKDYQINPSKLAKEAHLPGTWLFPKDCCNPFFDFAYLSFFEEQTILDTFQVTVSSTHSKDGSVIQRINQILTNLFNSKLDHVVHHAVLPSSALASKFKWQAGENVSKVTRSSRAPQIAKEALTDVTKETEKTLKRKRLCPTILEPSQRMTVDEYAQRQWQQYSTSQYYEGTIDIMDGCILFLEASGADNLYSLTFK